MHIKPPGGFSRGKITLGGPVHQRPCFMNSLSIGGQWLYGLQVRSGGARRGYQEKWLVGNRYQDQAGRLRYRFGVQRSLALGDGSPVGAGVNSPPDSQCQIVDAAFA